MPSSARRTVAALVLLGATVAFPAMTSPSHASAGVPPPSTILDEPGSGPAAADALGDDLDDVAAEHELSSTALEDAFETDPSLFVDETGRLFYVEPTVGDLDAPPGGSAAADPAPIVGDVFALHSQPGAQRVIYLDFDGHTTTGTAWNNNSQIGTGSVVTSPPFDLDGEPSTFSTQERSIVEETWARVAEDYAPFAIDVTTADPGQAAITRSGASDQVYGTRVVITANNQVGNWCGCGGIAYVGTFDISSNHGFYQPAFVFQAFLGGGAATAKTLAEATSHEAGHNLGLLHDGNASSAYDLGHDAWAPIMGAGYYRPITQWSRGEYAGASNTEDDLARMASFGATPLGDDHGDTLATATPVGAAASGRITTAADVDVFAITVTAGEAYATVRVDPAARGADLDVRLRLLDATGALVVEQDVPSAVVSAAEASGLDAIVGTTLPAGTYYAVVDGVGFGDPLSTGYSDYGSLGAYDVVVTQTGGSCTAAPAGIVGWWRGADSLEGHVGPDLGGPSGFAPGIVGRGLQLGGLEGLPTVDFPLLTSGVTVEAWIRPQRTGFTQAIFSRYRWIGGPDDDAYALFLADDQLLWINGQPSLMAPPSVTVHVPALFDGLFHHVAATRSASVLSIYVDGVVVASGPVTAPLGTAPATPLIVGGSSPDPGHALAFTGVIDEPTVYDRPLAPVEIQAIHDAGAGGKCTD